jgi:hypothetical protein
MVDAAAVMAAANDAAGHGPATTTEPTRPLTAAQILAAPRRQTRRVDCPEWGGSVLIQRVSLKVRDEIADAISRQKTGSVLMLATRKLVQACVVDEQGQPAFTAAQIEELAEVDAAVIDRVYKACWDFNGLGRDKVADDAKN